MIGWAHDRTPEDLSHLLTPELVEAWRDHDHKAIERLLPHAPWEPSIFDVTRPERPSWMRPSDGWFELWPKVWRLREALDRGGRQAEGNPRLEQALPTLSHPRLAHAAAARTVSRSLAPRSGATPIVSSPCTGARAPSSCYRQHLAKRPELVAAARRELPAAMIWVAGAGSIRRAMPTCCWKSPSFTLDHLAGEAQSRLAR